MPFAKMAFSRLGIIGVTKKKRVQFTFLEVERMTRHLNKANFHDLSITAFHLANPHFTYKEVGLSLGIPYFKAKLAIDAYYYDNCVIVESKINY